MTGLQCVKGMHDILPTDMPGWHFVEQSFKELMSQYAYREIRTPVLEPLELFVRGIGDATDIVEKEMYTFADKGGVDLALRPEGTASIVRAYIQHGLDRQNSINKLFYIGPMFRRERPARGRFRQFYQAGAELIGAGEPAADAEMIEMAVRFVQRLGISDTAVLINTLGDADTRKSYRDALRSYFRHQADRLCQDCIRRLENNPLRILDCKVTACIEACKEAPLLHEHVSPTAMDHFSALQQKLSLLNVDFKVQPRLVRGLDYYTRTIFEIQGGVDTLGAQSTIVGGGRYDGLIAQLGGKRTPTIGFAFGIERLLLLLKEDRFPPETRKIFVTGAGDDDYCHMVTIASMLRDAGFTVETPYASGSLRSHMKRAARSGARFTAIVGEEEWQTGCVVLRDMQTGEQEAVAIEQLAGKMMEKQ